MDGNNQVRRAVRIGLAAGAGLSVGAAGVVAAQDDVAVQAKVTVTGSRIKRVDMEGPQPVTVIDREQIDDSGDLSVADVLRSTVYNTFGSFQQRSGATEQSQNFVNLRGLGADKTLVLLDGRRMAGSPILSGQVQNLSVIPMAAVERIEILRDGASAIYGTDAIAGVINIILRQDYEGLQLGARWSRPTQSGGDEDQYTITGGVSGAKGNITFAFDAWQRDIVFDSQRSFSAVGLSSFGYPSTYLPFLASDDPRNPTGDPVQIGWFADPRCPEELNSDSSFPSSERFDFPLPPLYVNDSGDACRFNYPSASATAASNDTKSFFIDSHYDLNESTSFFARGLFTSNESFGRYAPGPLQFVRSADSVNNPTDPANPTNAEGDTFGGQSAELDTDGDGVADTTIPGPFDYTTRYRNVPGGDRDSNIQDTLLDYLAGIEGSVDWLGGMDWDLGVQWSKQISDDASSGLVIDSALNQQLASGALDIFAVNNASLEAARTAGEASALTTTRHSDTRITGFDGSVTFDAFQLRNGPVPVALGVEYRDEDWNQDYDEQTEAGNVSGSVPSGDSSGARVVKSVFAETVIPVLGSLETNLAVRYDDYNDFGTTINPKVSVAFRPLDVLLLRASYGTGFEAPSLSDLYSPPSQAFVDGIDSYQCSLTPEDTDGDGRANVPQNDLPDFHPCLIESGFGTTSGNRNLNPEKSTSWTAGFVWNPREQLSINLDYYDIKVDDAIGVAVGQDVLDEEFRLRQAGATGLRVGDVTRLPSGQLDNIYVPLVNRFHVQTRGVDADVSYGFSAGRFGDFSTRLQWTHVIEYSEPSALDRTQTESKQGQVGFPRDRGWLSFNWSLKDYSATIMGNYIADQNGTDTDPDIRLASWTTWDVQVSYATPWNGQITVGARNIFDRDPPHDGNFYETSQYDVFGRVPYVRWEQDL